MLSWKKYFSPGSTILTGKNKNVNSLFKFSSIILLSLSLSLHPLRGVKLLVWIFWASLSRLLNRSICSKNAITSGHKTAPSEFFWVWIFAKIHCFYTDMHSNVSVRCCPLIKCSISKSKINIYQKHVFWRDVILTSRDNSQNWIGELRQALVLLGAQTVLVWRNSFQY